MKERITITIEKELLSWLDSRIDSKIFANRSHGFEFLLFDEKSQGRTGSKETDSKDSKHSNETTLHKKSDYKEVQNKKRKNNED